MENGEVKQSNNLQPSENAQNANVVNSINTTSLAQTSANSFSAPSPVQTPVSGPVQPAAPQVQAPVQAAPTAVQQPAPAQVTQVAQTSVQAAPVTPAPVQPAAPVQAAPTVQTPVVVQPAQTSTAQPATSTVAPSAASTPVQPAAPVQSNTNNFVSKIENKTTNIATFKSGERDYLTKSDSKVEINITDNVDAGGKSSKKKEEEDEEVTGINNKASIILSIIFVVFLASAAVFYFIILSPKRAFLKTVEDMKILYAIPIDNFINNDREKMKISIGFSLDTEQSEFENSKDLESVEYIDGDYLQGIIDLDLINNNSKITFKADKSTENLKKLNILDKVTVDEKSETQKMLDFSVYSVEGKTYIGPIDYYNYNDVEGFGQNRITIDKKIQIDLMKALTNKDFNTTLSKDKLYDIEKVMAIFINKIVENIDDKEITRTIVSRKVDGVSRIFVKSNLIVDNKRLNEIYHKILQDFYNNKEEVFTPSEGEPEKVKVLDTLRGITGLTDDEIKEYLKEWIETDLSAKKVEINLFFSFSTRSNMGGMEVFIDDKYYYKVDSIEEKFVVDMGIIENKGKSNEHILAEMQIVSNRITSALDGVFSLDNNNTRLAITIDFDLLTNSKGEEIGNTLLLNFYNNETYRDGVGKPFARLDCKLEYYDNNDNPEKVNFDLKKEVEDAYVLPNISIAGMPTSSLEGAESISLIEASNMLKFENNLTHHIEYLIDHLLYNKDGALEKRKSNEATTPVDNNSTIEELNNLEENNTTEEVNNDSSTDDLPK